MKLSTASAVRFCAKAPQFKTYSQNGRSFKNQKITAVLEISQYMH